MKELKVYRNLRSTNGLTLDGYYKVDEYVEHNGKKFQLHCEIRNGDPLGFIYTKCFSILKEDGTFADVADCKMVGYPYRNDYYMSIDSADRYCDGLFNAFKDFIKMMY